MSDTPTPRTDAVVRKGCGTMVDPNFARALEREGNVLREQLAAAQKEIEELKREQLASNSPTTPGAALLLVRSQAKTAPKASDMDEPLE